MARPGAAIDKGITQSFMSGETTSSPSIAPSTVMAGVMTLWLGIMKIGDSRPAGPLPPSAPLMLISPSIWPLFRTLI